MDPLVIGVIALAVAITGFVVWQRRRSDQLRERYGNEYDRTVAELGQRRGKSDRALFADLLEEDDVRRAAPSERVVERRVEREDLGPRRGRGEHRPLDDPELTP